MTHLAMHCGGPCELTAGGGEKQATQDLATGGVCQDEAVRWGCLKGRRVMGRACMRAEREVRDGCASMQKGHVDGMMKCVRKWRERDFTAFIKPGGFLGRSQTKT